MNTGSAREKELLNHICTLENQLRVVLEQSHHWPDCSLLDPDIEGKCDCWLHEPLVCIGKEAEIVDEWSTS